MENDIRIKDLTNTALEMASDDYIGIDGLTNGTRKIPFSGIMDSLDSRFTTANKTPRGAIAELKQIVDSHGNVISSIKNMISDEYDDSADYDVGDYCIYDNVRYCCNTEISGGETWNLAHWDEAKVDEDISEIKQSLSQLADYSSTEVDTGAKWVDGKTIYKKTISDTTGSSSPATSTFYLPANTDTVVNIEFTLNYNSSGGVYCNNTFWSSNDYVVAWVANGNELKFRTTYLSRPFKITVYYTKS